ncbi:MAG: hypothetical protein H6745_00560 [Deltaproteobacteria bacterium]|nr:hypothetical protein [Deltaproteobacteria bacterium]
MTPRPPLARATLLLLSLALLAACGESAPPPAEKAPHSASSGVPLTGGGAASGAPAASPSALAVLAPSAADTHRAEVAAILAEARRLPPGAADALATAPIQRLALTLAPDGSYTGRLEVTALNANLEPVHELAFGLAPNADAATRRLTLDAVTVDGHPVDPRGGATVARVPVDLPPGARATVVITFAGTLPELPPFRLPDLHGDDVKPLADLLASRAEEDAAFGRRDGVACYGRAYPTLAPLGTPLLPDARVTDIGWLPPAVFDVTVTAAPDLVLAASGDELSRDETPTGAARTRLLAVGAREIGLVASSRFTVDREDVGGVSLLVYHTPEQAELARSVTTWARRALEIHRDAFGELPSARLAVAPAPLGGGLGGVSFPGLVALSDVLYAALVTGEGATPVATAIAKHPSSRETLEFILAHELAHQWWGLLVGADRARDGMIVDEGLAQLAAIQYFEKAHDAKAVRRQRELQLALPYQVHRLLGGVDRPLDTPPSALSGAMEAAGIVYGKGGSFFDTLARQISATITGEQLRDLARTARYGLVSLDDVVGRLVAHAPRPDDARALADRWIHATHADEDIGPLRPDLLFEYLVGDAAVAGGTRELLSQVLKDDQLRDIASALLGQGGQGLDEAALLRAVTDALGDRVDPRMRPWLDLAQRVMSEPASKWGPELVHATLDLVGDDLGLDAKDRALIEALGGRLIEALDDGGAADPGDDEEQRLRDERDALPLPDPDPSTP